MDQQKDIIEKIRKQHAEFDTYIKDPRYQCEDIAIESHKNCAALLDYIETLCGENQRLNLEAAASRDTLSAWFDLAKKAEDAGANILRDSLETWLRRAVNGGMPSQHAQIVREVMDEVARLYLWNALVPVLRTMHESKEPKCLTE